MHRSKELPSGISSRALFLSICLCRISSFVEFLFSAIGIGSSLTLLSFSLQHLLTPQPKDFDISIQLLQRSYVATTSPLHDELLRYKHIFVAVCVVHSLTCTAHSPCMHTCTPEENRPSTCLAKLVYMNLQYDYEQSFGILIHFPS